MELIEYAITVQAPGMTGHRFVIPATSVPTDLKEPIQKTLAKASQVAQDAILLHVRPIYSKRQPRDPSNRPRTRLRSALSDFMPACTDPKVKALMLQLKEHLSQ